MAPDAMQVVFEATLPVQQFDVFAEVGWLEDRPEITALCRAAAEGDGRIEPAVVEKSLPGVGERAARNIIRWVADLGLCDRRTGDLTATGRAVAGGADVPVPEQGVYRLWVIEHPLTGRRILHAERQAPDRDHRFEAIAPLPIEPAQGQPFTSVLDGSTRLTLRGFPSNHGEVGCLRRGDHSRVNLRWRWDMAAGQDHWALDGALAPGDRAITPADERAGIDPWDELARLRYAGAWSRGRWDADARTLRVAFEDVAEGEQDRFLGPCTLDVSGQPRFARFGPGRLTDVPLAPADATAAHRWAEARLDRRLADGTPRPREAVRRLWAELVEDTPLHPFAPTLPDHDTLLARHRDAPARYWALAAPVDLAPTPPTADALGALHLDAPAPAPVAEPSVVRIAHGARLSMADLIDRLAPPGATRWIFLCDRYVRGAANLAALGALVLTASARGAAVRVVTDLRHREAEPEAIEDLTGRAPQSYREVFGRKRRDQPHDRYLIIVGAHETCGWQLSNSPLDGRAPDLDRPRPDDPLRWRDLVATHCMPDQWPAGLAALIGGAS